MTPLDKNKGTTMDSNYFYVANRKQQGPVPFSQLRSLAADGTLKRTDKIWAEGMVEWIRAGTKVGLFEGLPPDFVEAPTAPRLWEPPPLFPSATVSTGAKRKTPWLMALLSLILPGLGQLLCGQKNKGVVFLAVSILGSIFSGGLTGLFLCPFLAFDAFSIAKKCNQGERIGEWEFCPTVPEIKRIKPAVLAGILVGLTLVAVLYVQHQRDVEAQSKADQFIDLLHQAGWRGGQ